MLLLDESIPAISHDQQLAAIALALIGVLGLLLRLLFRHPQSQHHAAPQAPAQQDPELLRAALREIVREGLEAQEDDVKQRHQDMMMLLREIKNESHDDFEIIRTRLHDFSSPLTIALAELQATRARIALQVISEVKERA